MNIRNKPIAQLPSTTRQLARIAYTFSYLKIVTLLIISSIIIIIIVYGCFIFIVLNGRFDNVGINMRSMVVKSNMTYV